MVWAFNASKGVIQALMEVPKFLPRNGPRGTYSQDWISRALQSLQSTMPNRCSSTVVMVMGSPKAVLPPTKNPTSISMSSLAHAVNLGRSSLGPFVCPLGLWMLVPESTIELDLP